MEDSSWITGIIDSDAGWNHVEDLISIGDRLSGGQGEYRAAEMTRDALEEVGVRDARIEEFPLPTGWTRRGSSLEPSSNTSVTADLDCWAWPYSPSRTASGRLIDLGYGLPSDFEDTKVADAVVLVSTTSPPDHRRVFRREKYDLAVEHGAAAVIFSHHLPGCLQAAGSVQGKDGALGEIPVVGVDWETGEKLRRRFVGDSLSVNVDADIGPETSQNVFAEIGPRTEDRVVVSAHLDSHDISEGAMDDAVGVGVVIEVARALVDREDELDTCVKFACFGAEQLGLMGSAYHVDGIPSDSVKVVLQNDGVARERDLWLVTNGFDCFEDTVSAVGERLGYDIETDPGVRLTSDHWRFAEQGIPSLNVRSQSASRDGRGPQDLILTPADTLDKLDPRDLREHAIGETELITELASDSVSLPGVSPGRVAEAVQRGERETLAGIYDRIREAVTG